MSAGRGTVRVAAPPEACYDYLADPVNRPDWQSSLRRVEIIDRGEPRVGQRWRDVTAVGMVPDMVTTVADRPHRWAEDGRWRAITATLTLDFRPDGEGCEVAVQFAVRGRGPLAAVGWLATRAGTPAVLGDLRRAARLIERQALPGS